MLDPSLKPGATRLSALRTETYALYLASRDPRVPWPAKALVALIIAYALSPIDLVPDFIPVLGYLDDVILIPLGIRLAVRMIPAEVLDEHRARAARGLEEGGLRSWVGAALVVLLWLIALAGLASVTLRVLGD